MAYTAWTLQTTTRPREVVRPADRIVGAAWIGFAISSVVICAAVAVGALALQRPWMPYLFVSLYFIAAGNLFVIGATYRWAGGVLAATVWWIGGASAALAPEYHGLILAGTAALGLVYPFAMLKRDLRAAARGSSSPGGLRDAVNEEL